MSIKSQQNKYRQKYPNIFFTPKLSLQGKNMFPQINDNTISNIFHRQPQPFLTVLKKPLMQIYDKSYVKTDKKPVCVIGKSKDVQIKTVRSNNLKKRRTQAQNCIDFLPPSKIKVETNPELEEQMKSIIQKPIYPSNDLIYKQGMYYFFIGPGNNSLLVEKLLNNRENWVQTTTTLYNFRWGQARPKYQTGSNQKRVINHLPNHEQLSDKGNLLSNLKLYCEKNHEELFLLLPLCFQFDFNNQSSCENQLKRFIQYYYQDQQRSSNSSYDLQNFIFINQDKFAENGQINQLKNISKKRQSYKNNGKLFKTIRKESYSGNYSNNALLINKKQEIRTIYKGLVAKLKSTHNFQDMANLKKQNYWSSPISCQVYGDTSLWLLKASDLNRGQGIFLFRSIQQLGNLLKKQLKKHEKGSFIVQKYIEHPMLLDQRKFDIRIWVLITQNRQVYVFKEGYIRTSSEKYAVCSKSNLIHLTNNAVQKNASNYGEFQQGNILPMSELYRRRLIEEKKLKLLINKYIAISYESVMDKIFTPNEKSTMSNRSVGIGNCINNNCTNKDKYFQILGYDFMLDTFGHLWLIQVNTNPCLELSSAWLKCLIPRMMDDALKLTLDRIFSKSKLIDNTCWDVAGYTSDCNMWDLLTIPQKINKD